MAMTPSQIIQAAREAYNAVGDTFYSDSELLTLMYKGAMQLARRSRCIKGTATTSTVANQQEYALSALNSKIIGIKRATWNGTKLKYINMREDDQLTLNNSSTTSTGNPQYYFLWNRTIYLRPIPSSIATLKLFTWNEPATLELTSTLDIPGTTQPGLINFLLAEMIAKDENFAMSKHYRELWLEDVQDAVKEERKIERGDDFARVQDEESLSETILGTL